LTQKKVSLLPHKNNLDVATVEGFGDEWTRFDQSEVPEAERQDLFDSYFRIFPWDSLPQNAVGFDAGCGSGRWAMLAAPRVGHLHCADPSSAIDVAARNLKHLGNVTLHRASIDEMPMADGSMDFGYSLGVLHHIPDTQAAMASCVRKLKPGAPFLVYLYYRFDNRPAWFRLMWKVSDLLRRFIAVQPHGVRYILSQIAAAIIYWPLARMARLAEKLGAKVDNWPLSSYRNRTFYMMRTDALDRFGTRLEQRFTRPEIEAMMKASELTEIRVSDDFPYWCAVGKRES
jgi:SAM-dependent methyltransferase